MTKVIKCKKPPVCDACKRQVKETNSKPFLLGCDDMLCKDCWYEWYDSGHSTRETLKAAVWKQHGEFGSEADLNEIYARRNRRRK